jgi:pyrroline-5-carboxylate reductase
VDLKGSSPNLIRNIMKIAFIGGGNMAAALIGGLIKRGVAPADLYAIDPNEDARKRNEEQFGVRTGASTDQALAAYDAVVLAVKPQILKSVAESIAPHLTTSQLVISIVAGIRMDDMSRWLNGHGRIVRVMPNTPALIGMGVTGLVATAGVDEAGRALASQVLGAVGDTVWFDDRPTCSISSKRCRKPRASSAWTTRKAAHSLSRPSLAPRNWPRIPTSRRACCANA